MEATLTDSETVSAANTSMDSTTDRPWLFKPGDPRINTAGRPRKGQTIAERVAKADAAVARKAIKARDKRLELTNAVGERAWTTYLAYNLGLPTQPFRLDVGESPLMDFLMRHTTAGHVVEGEHRILPPTTDTTTT